MCEKVELMDELSQEEFFKYEKMWAVRGYRARSPGERSLGEFLQMADMPTASTILDFGVGCGRPAYALQQKGFRVTGIDLTQTCLDPDILYKLNFVKASLWELPSDLTGDYGYCTDVMEHIPPEKVDAVLAEQVRTCKVGCFYQIATFHDSFGRKINEILHLTIENADWWEDKLKAHWPNVERGTSERRSPRFWCYK